MIARNLLNDNYADNSAGFDLKMACFMFTGKIELFFSLGRNFGKDGLN
jgi:hypothetical protein